MHYGMLGDHGCKQAASSLKVKAKLSLCLYNQAPHHEDVLGNGCIAPSFLISVLRGEWSASRSGRFTPGERAPVQEAGWAQEPVWTMWSTEKLLPLPGTERRPWISLTEQFLCLGNNTFHKNRKGDEL
jgi:hypothetical protein